MGTTVPLDVSDLICLAVTFRRNQHPKADTLTFSHTALTGCRGGLVCNDGGITSRVLLGEYGYQAQGNVISWDLSRVEGSINSLAISYLT